MFVPEENRIAREGDGLKIALTTLNTGRLALMAMAAGSAKWATKIAREWTNERAQWGRPIGKHDAVAQKVAFIAGSAFGLEAMLDVAGPAGRQQGQRYPDRGGAVQGVRLGAGLAGGRSSCSRCAAGVAMRPRHR